MLGSWSMTISIGLILIATIREPLGSSSLGGCPASCPDTYRLTHDHRHVRNWASVEISVLSQQCNYFFSVWGNFPNTSFQPRAGRVDYERLLRFSRACGSEVVPAAQRFLESRLSRVA